jgi:hypothetical protein
MPGTLEIIIGIVGAIVFFGAIALFVRKLPDENDGDGNW